MMAMGLALTVRDLQAVFSRPKGIIGGLSTQLFVLPLLGIGFGLLYDSPPVIAAGAIILCACPGGVTSNGPQTRIRSRRKQISHCRSASPSWQALLRFLRFPFLRFSLSICIWTAPKYPIYPPPT
jgi:hypothetical protein